MSKKLFVSALVTGLATTALMNAQDANAAAPELTVPKDQYVEYGKEWNPYESVKAYDAEDGDLTGDVLWDTTQYVDTFVPGMYDVKYRVWDFDDNLTKAMSKVHVLNEGETKPQMDVPTETEVGTETNENPQVDTPTENETSVEEPAQEVPSEDVPTETPDTETNENPQVDTPTEDETEVNEPAQEVPSEDVPVETPDTETNENPQVDTPAEDETQVDEPTQEVPNEDVPTANEVVNETPNTENPQTDETTSNNGQEDQSMNDNSQVGGLLTGSEQGVKPEDIAAAKARYEAEQKKKEHEANANKDNLSNAKSTDVNKKEKSTSHQGVKSSTQVHQSGSMESTNQGVNTNGMQSSMKQQAQGSDEKGNTMQLLPNTGQEQSNGMIAGLMALFAGVATFFGFRRKSSQK